MPQTSTSFFMGGRRTGGVPVELHVSSDQWTHLERELKGVRNGVERAIQYAINRAVRSGRTFVTNTLRDLLTTKRSNIFQRTETLLAKRGSLAGAVRVQGRRIGLPNFMLYGATLRRPMPAGGVRVRVHKDGSELQFKSAFLGIGLSGNKHVFVRDRKRGKQRQRKAHHRPNIGRNRQPIRALYGVSLLHEITERPVISRAVEAHMRDAFETELNRQVERLRK